MPSLQESLLVVCTFTVSGISTEPNNAQIVRIGQFESQYTGGTNEKITASKVSEGKKMTENQLAEMFENIRSLKAMTKEVMTINECAQYTGLSVSYLYKLTHRKLIPFFKPMGKRLYFKRAEIDQWLMRNKQGDIYEAS